MEAAFISSNSFSVEGTKTGDFVEGRRLKLDCGVDGTFYATVVSSEYTTVTVVTIDESSLTSNLVSVLYSSVKPGVSGNLPDHFHSSSEGDGGYIEAPTVEFIGLTDTPSTYSGTEGQYLQSTGSGTVWATISGGGGDVTYEDLTSLSGTLQTQINSKQNMGNYTVWPYDRQMLSIINPGAETGDSTGWVDVIGGMAAKSGGFDGDYFFFGGTSEITESYQEITLISGAVTVDLLDSGTAELVVDFYASSYHGDTDNVKTAVVFYNNLDVALNTKIYSEEYDYYDWTLVSNTYNIPPKARYFRLYFYFKRNSGTNNDGYVDSIIAYVPVWATQLEDIVDIPTPVSGNFLKRKDDNSGYEWATVSGTGGGGTSDVQSFLDLNDTPISYLDNSSKYLKTTPSGIMFADLPDVNVQIIKELFDTFDTNIWEVGDDASYSVSDKYVILVPNIGSSKGYLKYKPGISSDNFTIVMNGEASGGTADYHKIYLLAEVGTGDEKYPQYAIVVEIDSYNKEFSISYRGYDAGQKFVETLPTQLQERFTVKVDVADNILVATLHTDNYYRFVEWDISDFPHYGSGLIFMAATGGASSLRTVTSVYIYNGKGLADIIDDLPQNFTDFIDTPSTYSGTEGQYLQSTGSGTVWATVSGGGGGSSDVQSFLDLNDTEDVYLDGSYVYSTSSGIEYSKPIISGNGVPESLITDRVGMFYVSEDLGRFYKKNRIVDYSVFQAKSVVVDILTQQGGISAWGTGIRSIEFHDASGLVAVTENDFTAYQQGAHSSSYHAKYVFDTSLPKTGPEGPYVSWVWGVDAPLRLICVFDEAIQFNKVIVNNFHNNGSGNRDWGAKDMKIFATLDTYTNVTAQAVVSNYSLVFDGTIDIHVAEDIIDDQELALEPIPTDDTGWDLIFEGSSPEDLTALSGTLQNQIDSMVIPSTFLDLDDTPTTYSGGQYLRTTTSGISAIDGIILKAPNDSEWLIQVTNSGTLYTVEV